MIVEEQDYLMHDAFLEHFGVPGMKWGIRKNRNLIKARNAMLRAKDAKKQANKKYNNDYDSAYNYSGLHLISQNFGKNKRVSDKKWSDVIKSAQDADKANKAYKDAKKAYKDAKKTAKAEYKAKYKKALENNKAALIKNSVSYNQAADKSFDIYDRVYNKTYDKAIKSGAKKSKAERTAKKAAIKVSDLYENKARSKYKQERKKLKQDRYYIKKVGV